MADNSSDEGTRMNALCEVIADAFEGASDQEIDQAINEIGLSPETLTNEVTTAIEGALNRSLKKKLVEAGQAARRGMSAHRPDLMSLTREQLIEELKLITANDDNAAEMLTMAARAGRNSMPVEELRSLIADFYSISRSGTRDD